MDGGAWWAAVHGVAKSRTKLTRLSSSSSVCLEYFAIFNHYNNLNVAYCFTEYKLRLNKEENILQTRGSQSVVPGSIILASPQNLLEQLHASSQIY